MRAVVFERAEQAAAVADVELAAPGPGEVKVQIAAAGVCHSDLHVRKGDWDLPLPLVMGHEGSGIVVELGAGVTELQVGDHVVLSWVAPCGHCRSCLRGHDVRCEVAATTVALGGNLNDGTSRLSLDGRRLNHYLGVSSFAEAAVVTASGAIRVRKDAPLEVLALVGCAVATGVGAVVNTAAVEAGSLVAVVGCGGVGLSVVQGARLAGAERVVAIDLRADKTALAMTLGATDALVVGDGDLAEQLRELLPDGVDYAFDAIGKISTTEQCIDMLALGGAAVIVGITAAGTRASFEPQNLVDRDQRILGSNYGGVRPSVDIPRIVDQYMNGQIQLDPLVSGRRSLDEAEACLTELAEGGVLRQLLIP